MTNSSTTVFYPAYYQIIERRGNGWAFKHGEPFINLFNAPTLSIEDEFAVFDTSMKKVAIELFRINGGKQGYYIANILDKKYYYCGTGWSDVKAKLQELGIGRAENSYQ
ncbi:hypothetical protein G7B40_004010 [Aetokthonos hydrillicola Thurmond2011]|jgi:hypothetical protein|uniref:Uncharacterized protein n=1 Tax=Aetokthonos hydrillicola Thurmond2011 TaxID=2712845 RepID=A0AAP5I5Z0_9CYAN|nr:hypothetical protein [Aetokthonos hydrillicola]MBO3457448.1 hypothetical protein [Aetokthonos hydrillicola CCALA 1050]MBW4586031.1 hypothetical protein [Aetokthonos hydrillicola CCALA 1050]MDR9893743.1 hypothetical protein [Aetokthonos hydrillicola Thurmond2011]